MTSTTGSRVALALAPAGALVMAWAAWVKLADVDAIIAPSPALVVRDLRTHGGTYLTATLETIRTSGLGLLIGTVAGGVLAVAAWWSSVLRGMVRPVAGLLRAVPIVAVIPIVARTVGYGSTSTMAITSIITFFPTYVLVGSGLRDLPSGSHDVIAVLGADRTTALRRLALPAAVPSLAVAFQLTVTLAVLGGVAAEYLTGTGGLGELFAKARFDYRNPARGWGVAVCTMALSAGAYAIATHLRRLALDRFR